VRKKTTLSNRLDDNVENGIILSKFLKVKIAKESKKITKTSAKMVKIAKKCKMTCLIRILALFF